MARRSCRFGREDGNDSPVIRPAFLYGSGPQLTCPPDPGCHPEKARDPGICSKQGNAEGLRFAQDDNFCSKNDFVLMTIFSLVTILF